MEKVDQKTAIELVNAWMDSKRIRPKRREELKKFTENLVDAVVFGDLTMNDDGCLNYKLVNPIDGALDSLTFKLRINEFQMDKYRPSVKNIQDPMLASTLLTLATLTDVSTAMLKQLDKSTDFPLCESIAIFFM